MLALQPEQDEKEPADRSEPVVYPCMLQNFHPEKDGVRNVGLVFLHKEEVPSYCLAIGQTFSAIRHGRPVAKITLLSHLEETD